MQLAKPCEPIGSSSRALRDAFTKFSEHSVLRRDVALLRLKMLWKLFRKALRSSRHELPANSTDLDNCIRNSKMARRFEVLHRRNHFVEVPEAPEFAMADHLCDASRQN